MSGGFGEGNKLKLSINKQEINNIIKRYKKAKKIMKSNLYQVQVMDETETYISGLIQEAEADPPVTD
jgi:ATP:corrinoid adenosyltransferase